MMLGCKSVSLFSFVSAAIDCHLVYRVNWLRAKARRDRWNEELLIIKHEMKWTILWFEHQMKEWQGRLGRGVEEKKPGHVAYAEKQVAMWKRFMRQGEHGFKAIMVD